MVRVFASFFAGFVFTAFSFLLLGCGAGTRFDSAPAITAKAGVSFSGSGGGGQQPIVGAQVMLFAAGESGYGTASGVLSSNGQSVVTTDANGAFILGQNYTCTPGTLLYAVLSGVRRRTLRAAHRTKVSCW